MYKIANKSRAEYFRERRKQKKQLVFMLDNDKAEKLDEKIKEKNMTRSAWFRQKVDEEIGEKK